MNEIVKELHIPLDQLNASPVQWPEKKDFIGLDLHLVNNALFCNERIEWDTMQHSPRRLYPAEFTVEQGVYIFGVKEGYTPHCYAPEVKIRLDVHNRTYQVLEMDDDWEQLIEYAAEDGTEPPYAIFKFYRAE